MESHEVIAAEVQAIEIGVPVVVPRTRMRRSEVEGLWRQVMAEFTQASQKVRDFCSSRSISEPAFYRWRRTLARRDVIARKNIPDQRGNLPSTRSSRRMPAYAATVNNPQPRTSFVPVRVVGEDPSRFTGEAPLEIVLASGHRLRVARRDQIAWLGDVLAALGD